MVAFGTSIQFGAASGPLVCEIYSDEERGEALRLCETAVHAVAARVWATNALLTLAVIEGKREPIVFGEETLRAAARDVAPWTLMIERAAASASSEWRKLRADLGQLGRVRLARPTSGWRRHQQLQRALRAGLRAERRGLADGVLLADMVWAGAERPRPSTAPDLFDVARDLAFKHRLCLAAAVLLQRASRGELYGVPGTPSAAAASWYGAMAVNVCTLGYSLRCQAPARLSALRSTTAYGTAAALPPLSAGRAASHGPRSGGA